MPSVWIRLPLVLLLAFMMSGNLWADCKQHKNCELCEYSAPQLWIVNTRCAPKCNGLEEGFQQIRYERYCACQDKFYASSLEELLAAQQNIPTIIFSHGNGLDYEAAMDSCWKFYERLKVCPGPKLMIFWQWPAEIAIKEPLLRPIKLARANIRVKYVYAEHQGYYIAKFTELLDNSQPLTLSGHSFGGVTVIAAMHYLGGGCLHGRVLPGAQPVERHNLRGVIISGALDCDALYPGHRYGNAFDAVQQFYTTYNDRDSTLSHWPTHSLRDQEALGYKGMCRKCLGVNAYKLRQDYLTEDVKRSHYMKPHLASVQMMSSLCCTAFDTHVHCKAGGTGKGLRSFGNDIMNTMAVPDINMNTIRRVPAQIIAPGLAF